MTLKSPFFFALFCIVHASACGSPDKPPLAGDDTDSVGQVSSAEVCEEGEVGKCVVYTSAPRPYGTHNCVHGERVCKNGAWDACADSESFASSVQTFSASCPPGQKPHWSTLSYDLAVPADKTGTSGVRVFVRTNGAARALAIEVPGADAATCPAGCSKSLAPFVGQEARSTLTLEFEFSRTPSGRFIGGVRGIKPDYVCSAPAANGHDKP